MTKKNSIAHTHFLYNCIKKIGSAPFCMCTYLHYNRHKKFILKGKNTPEAIFYFPYFITLISAQLAFSMNVWMKTNEIKKKINKLRNRKQYSCTN